MSPFDRADRAHQASLDDVAEWQRQQPPPPPAWLAPALSLALLIAWGVIIMAAWTVWEWLS